MKRIIAILVAVIMIFALTACKANSEFYSSDDSQVLSSNSYDFSNDSLIQSYGYNNSYDNYYNSHNNYYNSRVNSSYSSLHQSQANNTSYPDFNSNSNYKKYVYSGTGDKVINNINIPKGISYYAEVLNSKNANSNFIVKLHHNDTYELLANEIGYSKAQLYIDGASEKGTVNGKLEVKSTGNWEIRFYPIYGKTTANFSGSGEVITRCFTATQTQYTVKLTHSGSRNFIVKVNELNGTDYELLSNEIGNYNGSVVVTLEKGKTYFLSVNADGKWAVDFGTGESVTEYHSYNIKDIVDSGDNANSESNGEMSSATTNSKDGTITSTDMQKIKSQLSYAIKYMDNSTKYFQNSMYNQYTLSCVESAISPMKIIKETVDKCGTVKLSGSSDYSTLNEWANELYRMISDIDSKYSGKTNFNQSDLVRDIGNARVKLSNFNVFVSKYA